MGGFRFCGGAWGVLWESFSAGLGEDHWNAVLDRYPHTPTKTLTKTGREWLLECMEQPWPECNEPFGDGAQTVMQEDVLQDLWTHTPEVLLREVDQAHAKNLIKRMVRMRMIDQHRRDAQRQGGAPVVQAAVADTAPTPAQQAEAVDLVLEFEQYVEKTRGKKKAEIVPLLAQGAQTNPEIAQELGITTHAAKKRMHRDAVATLDLFAEDWRAFELLALGGVFFVGGAGLRRRRRKRRGRKG